MLNTDVFANPNPELGVLGCHKRSHRKMDNRIHAEETTYLEFIGRNLGFETGTITGEATGDPSLGNSH